MVTDSRPTTLAQFKAALERVELAQKALSQELASSRQANTQLGQDLQAAKNSASRAEQQLGALQQSSQAELAQLRQAQSALEQRLREAQAEAQKAQAELATTEAQASRQLEEANALMGRLKLAAVAGADREVKLNAEIADLRQRLERALAAQPDPAHTGAQPAQLAQLRQQLDAMVGENRELADLRDRLQADQALLGATIEGHQQATAKAVEQARSEVQRVAQLETQRLQDSLGLLQARLSSMAEQLQAGGKLEVLGADQVGALMGRFLQQVEGGIPSLRLAEGELKLKLGLARAGETPGFVILQPDAAADAKLTLHEVALKFDRAGALDLPEPKP